MGELNNSTNELIITNRYKIWWYNNGDLDNSHVELSFSVNEVLPIFVEIINPRLRIAEPYHMKIFQIINIYQQAHSFIFILSYHNYTHLSIFNVQCLRYPVTCTYGFTPIRLCAVYSPSSRREFLSHNLVTSVHAVRIPRQQHVHYWMYCIVHNQIWSQSQDRNIFGWVF